MTTKTQELEALGKIRKILGTLDSDSWVNTAFKGVCDIAERNIEDDSADSPVERVVQLEGEIEENRKELEEMKVELCASELDKNELQDTYVSSIERYNKLTRDYDVIRNKKDQYEDLLIKLSDVFEDTLADANSIILENCTNTNAPQFKKAVADRQIVMTWIKKIDRVVSGK